MNDNFLLYIQFYQLTDTMSNMIEIGRTNDEKKSNNE